MQTHRTFQDHYQNPSPDIPGLKNYLKCKDSMIFWTCTNPVCYHFHTNKYQLDMGTRTAIWWSALMAQNEIAVQQFHGIPVSRGVILQTHSSAVQHANTELTRPTITASWVFLCWRNLPVFFLNSLRKGSSLETFVANSSTNLPCHIHLCKAFMLI